MDNIVSLQQYREKNKQNVGTKVEQHTIPLGSLVEVVNTSSELYGVRLFVVNYSYAYNKEPLYDLSCYVNIMQELANFKSRDDFLNKREKIIALLEGSIVRFFRHSDIKVIKP